MSNSHDTSRFSVPVWVAILATFLVVVGVIARIWFLRNNVYPSFDGTYYLVQAMGIAQDGQFVFGNFPPGWPLLVGLGSSLLGAGGPGQFLQVAEVLNLIVGLAAICLLYLWAKETLGTTWAAMPALTMLALPLHLSLSYSDLSELSFLATVTGGLVLFQKRRPGPAGLVLGYSCLIRPEGLLVLAFVCLTAMLSKSEGRWRLLGTGLLPFLAYQTLALAETGSLSAGKSGWLHEALFARSTGENIARYFANLRTVLVHLVDLVGVPIVLLGIWAAIRQPGRWLVLTMTLPLLPIFTFRMDHRYLLVPVAGLLIGATSVLISNAAPRPRWIPALVAIWIVSFGIAAYDDYRSLRANYEFYPTMREAGLWVAENSDETHVVAGRKPYVSFWGEREFLRLPAGLETNQLLEWVRESGARFLPVHRGVAYGMEPGLVPLVEGVVPTGFRRVQEFRLDGRPDEDLVLLEVIRR